MAVARKIETGAQVMGAEERRVREDLAALYRLVALHGWDDLVFTHISARVPGPEGHFLINPYGLMFEEITASSLVKVGADGEPVEDSPYKANRAGFVIHSALHLARPDAHFVIHVHTDYGQAVSAQRDGLLPLTQTAMFVAGEVAYHDYEGVAEDLDERERLAADLGDRTCMILRNHGTLAVGANAAEAFTRIYFLERACKAQVLAQAGGGALIMPSGAAQARTADITRGAFENGLPATLIWPALLRRLDRHSPGFRD